MLDDFLNVLMCEATVPTATPLVIQGLAMNHSLLLPFIFLWWAVFRFNAYYVPALGTSPLHSFVNHFAAALWAQLRFAQIFTTLFCARVDKHMNVHEKGRKVVVHPF
jgi:hypothetical protein